jgi:hypothetical protein
MPFSAQYDSLFIHIPRTGGTTIEKILGIHREWPTVDFDVLHGQLAIGNEEYQLQHLSLQEASQFLPKSTGNRFSFTFVRNPWDRLVSEYFWRSGGSGEFDLFVDSACEVVNSRKELAGRNCHLRPQVEFLSEQISFVGRFEFFHSDVTKVLTALRIEMSTVPHENRTAHRCYTEYYSARSRKRVASAYEADIDSLKYSFERAG